MFRENRKLVALRHRDKNVKDDTIPKEMIVGHLFNENVNGEMVTQLKKLRNRKLFGLIGER